MLNKSHLSSLIHEQAKTYGERVALSYRDYDKGQWVPISWCEFSRKVRLTSVAMLKLGIREQENVATFSQNKPECLFADFGAYGIRAVTIPFYATSSAAQVSFMVNDADVRFVFVGEQQQYDTAISIVSVCPSLEKIIIFDNAVRRRDHDVTSVYFSDLLADAAGAEEQFAAEISRRTAAASFDDIANILYTSGTTGASKGVILTHGMYAEGFRVNDAVLPLSDKDVILCFLPFTHVFERAWSYLCLCEGAQLAVNLRPQDVLRSLQEVHPTCMSSVPRFWEKVYQGVIEKLDSASTMERKLIGGALKVGAEAWTNYLSKKKPLPLSLSLKLNFYRATAMKALRKKIGLERANFFPTAGAAVSPAVEKFVHTADIYMIVGYGMTETTATVTCDHVDKANSLGSVGRLIDGIEIKFGENNEILLRGKTITPGYYKRPDANAEAFDEEGFLHTGDAGYLKDGELYLTERIKDLFKTSNGKYIAPQMIESKFAVDKYIEQVVVVANERKFVSALIVPAYNLLEKYAQEQGIAVDSREALCSDPRILEMLTARIDLLQQDLAHYEKVKRFVLLTEAFTMENGELTNTLKVKRRVVYDRYARLIDRVYAEAEATEPIEQPLPVGKPRG